MFKLVLRALLLSVSVVTTDAHALSVKEARHLITRTKFGGSPHEIAALLPLTRAQVVNFNKDINTENRPRGNLTRELLELGINNYSQNDVREHQCLAKRLRTLRPKITNSMSEVCAAVSLS